MPAETSSAYLHRSSSRVSMGFRPRIRQSGCAGLLWLVLLASWSIAPALEIPDDANAASSSATAGTTLPDAPSATPSNGFGESLGTAVKTIGSDEWHVLKYPFEKKAIVWDALVVGATGVLIANDESVAHQVPQSWHNTSINVSNAGVYGLGAAAGGIFFAGLITHNEHATNTGIRSAEASVDSVILYAALKAILARQRPYMGQGDGKFFSGNWTSGSFPSGHATFAWTLASVMAHEYPNWPMRLLMYGAATAVSTTRVTGGAHFPSDVFSGSVIGYGVGTYVAHKDRHKDPSPHSQNKLNRLQNAVLGHVVIQ
jgi:membrane-associated phospholipid phosphatase